MEKTPFAAPELEQALKHDSARKEVEGVHHLRPVTPAPLGGDVPMSYPPYVKACRLKHGEVAALIWDRGGHCTEVWIKEGEARPRRLEIAAQFLSSWTRNTAPIETEDQHRQARFALELADVLIEEAGR
jgi:hypothetical protein